MNVVVSEQHDVRSLASSAVYLNTRYDASWRPTACVVCTVREPIGKHFGPVLFKLVKIT